MTIARTSRTASAGNTGEVVLRTRHLTKRYGERLAVSDLNIEGRRGDVLGFLGPNGAGKTTTIRMLLGLIRPTAGSVEIMGMNVASDGARALPHVGALVEQPALYPWLSGRDNLRAVGDALGGVSERRIDAVLDLIALRERDRDRVKTYSLGMKQRLGLGLALLHDPDILTLDEPTNGLDPAGIVEMRDLLKRLASENKLVFISSHALGEVQQMCSRVAVIALGQLITETTVEELTSAQGMFIVEIDRPAGALALLRAQPWGATATLGDGGRLISPAPDGESGALNLFLVRSGFTPTSIAPYTRGLEEIFLSMTGAARASAEKGDAQ